MLFSTHVNHVSVSPTNGIGDTQGQRKTLTRLGIEPPNSISRANAHMVYMGTKKHFTLPFHAYILGNAEFLPPITVFSKLVPKLSFVMFYSVKIAVSHKLK